MRQRLRPTSIAVVVVVVLVAIGWYRLAGHTVPAGQPELATVSADSFARLAADFNRASDTVRLVVLLSPT